MKKKSVIQGGFGIIEVLVASGMLVLVAAGIMYLISTYQTQQKQILINQRFLILQKQFADIISDQRSWKNTLFDSVNNPNMSCLRNHTDCAAIGNVSSTYANTQDRIVLKDSTNTIFYDGRASSTQGFTHEGFACNTFSYTGAGSDLCPIGYIINWRALTSTASNQDIQIAVVAKLVYNPSSTNKLKNFYNRNNADSTLKKYDVEVFKSPQDNQIDQYMYKCVPGTVDTNCQADAFATVSERICNSSGNGYSQCLARSCSGPGIQLAPVNGVCICSLGKIRLKGACQ
jgi:type II secretory pathway pseudopilin PulG